MQISQVLEQVRTQWPPFLKISYMVASTRPDIVLEGVDEVTLIELTIPHNLMESLIMLEITSHIKESICTF